MIQATTQNTAPPEHDDAPVTDLVHRLHDGDMQPDELSAPVRRRCVSQLSLEGLTAGEIGQLMRISERTVHRDRATARRESAVAPGRTLGDELLGEFQQISQACIQRLTRMTREPDTPPYARLWAEEAIVRIHHRLIDTTHRMKYLEEGQSRLAHERETDPAEHERSGERMKALRAMVGGV